MGSRNTKAIYPQPMIYLVSPVIILTETLPLKRREVLANVPSLLRPPSGCIALDSRWQDFWADALRHGEHPCFGGELPPHSHVAVHPLSLPARASPHVPRWLG